MEFRAYFKHMPSSLATYAYAEKKLGERLEKYALRVLEAHLTFAAENGEFSVACHVVADGGINYAIENADPMSMTAAIDGLADKLDARLRRKKEKLRSHRERDTAAPLPFVRRTPEEAAPTGQVIDAAEILAVERQRQGIQRLRGAE